MLSGTGKTTIDRPAVSPFPPGLSLPAPSGVDCSDQPPSAPRISWVHCTRRDTFISPLSCVESASPNSFAPVGSATEPYPSIWTAHRGAMARARRHDPGLSPVKRRNSLVKCAWSARPQLTAICAKGVDVVSINPCARSTRCRIKYA